jgi:hypothetical protein
VSGASRAADALGFRAEAALSALGAAATGGSPATFLAVSAIVSVLVVCCSVVELEQAASSAKAGSSGSRERRIRVEEVATN